ncbi:hypothetical protein FRB93_004009 [Tulasnella sp. JGI-2019a]|nr:hypothetical protein FRB93_004009 [Tulasnella sp. JGI-2019a]
MSTTNASTAAVPSLLETNYGKRSLKKNQACLQCRKGKMKCDAAQPQCTNCVRAWQLIQETPELAVDGIIPEAPECHYDPVEGLVFAPETISDPVARSKAIQDHLAQLQLKLQEARDEEKQTSKKRPSSSGSGTAANNSRKRRHTAMEGDATADNSDNSQSRVKRPRASTTFTIHEPVSTSSILNPPPVPSADAAPAPEAGPSRQQSRLSAPNAPTRTRSRSRSSDEIPYEQLQSLLDAYISNDPHSSRIFHIRSLRASFKKHGSSSPDSQTPSRALVHAICAVGARYMAGPPRTSGSTTPATRPADHPDVDPLFASFPSMKGLLNLHSAMPKSSSNSNMGTSGDVTPATPHNNQPAPEWKAFAANHATRARQLINGALARHQTEEAKSMSDPFASSGMSAHAGAEKEKDARDSMLFRDVLQPLLVLTTYYYHEARSIELWANIGALARNIMALRLDLTRQPSSPGSRQTDDDTIIEAERKRTLWSTFVLDRFISLGGGAHAIPGEDSFGKPEWLRLPPMPRKTFNDLGTPLAAFDSPPSGPISDSFALLIDATIMLGRVTESRTRPFLKRRPPTSQSSLEFSIFHGQTDAPQFSGMNHNARWETLRLYSVLVDGIGVGCRGNGGVVPVRFLHPIGVVDTEGGNAVDARNVMTGKLDTDLFLAHMVHHATMILLTFSMASFTSTSQQPLVLPTVTADGLLSQFLRPESNPSATTALGAVRRRSLSSGLNREPSPTRLTPYNANAISMPATPAPSSPVRQPISLTSPDAVDPPDCSLERVTEACVAAARSVVDALTLIRATSFDITRLHPFVSTCWYLAAVVLLHEHRRCGLAGDIMKKGMTAREVQMLRLALLKYGARSPIGSHHERQLTLLLDQIMSVPASAHGSMDDIGGGIDPFNDILLGNTHPQYSASPVTFQLPHIPIFPFDAVSLTQDHPYETSAPLPDISG